MKFSLFLWIVTVSLIVAIDYWAVDAVVVVAEATDISNNTTANANIGSTLLSLSDHDLIYDEEEEIDEHQQHDTDNYMNGSITNDGVLVEEGEKVGIADQYNKSNNDGCDESKCVSTGLDMLSNLSFTCYAADNYRPMMCADGYKPRIVENETTVYYGGYDYQYFTCCPPNLSSNVKVSRHCSNSTSINNGWEDPNNNKMVCDDTTKPYHHEMKTSSSNKPYPRQMKTRRFRYYDFYDDVESHICCDSIINGNKNGNNYQTSNFLDKRECVPYSNEFYLVSWTRNMYGSILPAYCDEPESGFQFPRYVEYNKTSRIHPFECCKTDPGLPPFIQDYFFKITIYPQMVISAIAVISSIVLIIALLIPLFCSLRSQSTRTRTTTRSTNARTRSQTTTEPAYSSYNLYMVFLAIPDLILNLYLVIMYGSYANQEFNPNFYGTIIYPFGRNYSTFEGAFILACSTANLVRISLLFNCAFSL
jgi:hypothetical protein